jgi:hypothetical protein
LSDELTLRLGRLSSAEAEVFVAPPARPNLVVTARLVATRRPNGEIVEIVEIVYPFRQPPGPCAPGQLVLRAVVTEPSY